MKRKKRKTIEIVSKKNDTATETNFYADCLLIQYNLDQCLFKNIQDVKDISFEQSQQQTSWLNFYGFQYHDIVRQIIHKNKIDEFIINLTAETNHRNKAIELTNCFFFTLKAPIYSKNNQDIDYEQLFFIVGENYIWTIQEVKGDHFEHIRTRLRENIGLVRRKGVDYLFYLLVEAVIDTYYSTYESLLASNNELKSFANVSATSDFAELVETKKNHLFQIKKASFNLKEALNQLEKLELENFNIKYLVELKEQIGLMNDEIDFNLLQLESSINLIINIQNNRLNEVMRTLTILSVIFIPLTFLAGIYGMNFENIPETKTEYGYFVILGVMLILVFLTLFYFKKKKWFD